MKVVSKVETITEYDDNENVVYRKVTTKIRVFEPRTDTSTCKQTFTKNIHEETFYYDEEGNFLYSDVVDK